MRNLVYTMLLSLFIVCCKDNDMQSSGFPTGIITDISESYNVPAVSEGNIITFTIMEPTDCSVVSNQEWCVVETNNEDAGQVVNLKISNNQSNEARRAEITISSPKVKDALIVEIIQLSAFELKGFKEDVSPEGETFDFTVYSSDSWTLTPASNCSWIRIDTTTGGANEEKTVKLTVDKNETGIIRVAEIKYEQANGLSKTYKIYQTEPEVTQKRVGDPELEFDETRIDPRYETQMNEWEKAGVEGGIPYLNKIVINKEFEAGASFDDIKKYLDSHKEGMVAIKLKNGVYNLKKEFKLNDNQTLIGESKEGVEIHLSEKGKLSMYDRTGCGMRNFTVIGKWADHDPDPTLMQETIAERGGERSIDMAGAVNCYVDNVRIVNSLSHPIWISPRDGNDGHNNTIRDVEIDGAYNKGGGCQGYFFIKGTHNLITGCKVIHLRHISMQDPEARYNVVYKNDFSQEVSFHNNDGGDNLVEHNKIRIPTTLGHYNAIMGPWSTQHKVGGINYVYRNRCVEENLSNNTPWSDNKFYIGPKKVVVGDPTNPERYTNFYESEEYPAPIGYTLYPVILK